MKELFLRGGMFITFEGIDGSGKTTAAQKLKEFIISKGFPVFLFHEPNGEYRNMLMDDRQKSNGEELFLFLANRARDIEEKIKPALQKGEIVICDRFLDSTIVYQALLFQEEPDWLYTANLYACQNKLPDITFLLDTSPHIAMERFKKRGTKNKFDREGNLKYLCFLQEKYLEWANETCNQKRIKVVDGNQPVENILQFFSNEEAKKDALHYIEKNPGMWSL